MLLKRLSGVECVPRVSSAAQMVFNNTPRHEASSSGKTVRVRTAQTVTPPPRPYPRGSITTDQNSFCQDTALSLLQMQVSSGLERIG